MPSPWRAGADECTVMSLPLNVNINGKNSQPGNYAFHWCNPTAAYSFFNRTMRDGEVIFYRKNLMCFMCACRSDQRTGRHAGKACIWFRQPNRPFHWYQPRLERWLPDSWEVRSANDRAGRYPSADEQCHWFDPASLEAAANMVRGSWYQLRMRHWTGSQFRHQPATGRSDQLAALSTNPASWKNGKGEWSGRLDNGHGNNASALELHGYGRQLMAEKLRKHWPFSKKLQQTERGLANQCRHDAHLFSHGRL